MAADADSRSAPGRPGLSKWRTAVLRRLRGGAVIRLGWGVADQAVSSLTNFAVSIYVVHVLGAVQFGAFSLAYVTYAFALTASRGLATDPLMVRFSGTDLPAWKRAVARCTGTAAVVGFAVGACVLAAAALLGGTVRGAFLALGLTLPGLLLQDSWRYSFFALGRGSQAFLNDSIWAVALLPALVLLRVTGTSDVFWYVFAWGAAAAVGAIAGPLQARVVPRMSASLEWLWKHRDLGPRYLAEGATFSAATQLRTYGIGIILGLATVGVVQAVATLMGPITILFLGMSLVAIPEAARILRRSPRRLPLFCLLITSGLAMVGIAWGLVLLVVLPRGLGNWLVGPIWRQAYHLVIPQALFSIGTIAGLGAGVGLHALGAARRSLWAMILTSCLYLSLSLAGAAVGGAAGTVSGSAIAAWIGSLIVWWQLAAALRESRRTPIPKAAMRRPRGRHTRARPARRPTRGLTRRRPTRPRRNTPRCGAPER